MFISESRVGIIMIMRSIEKLFTMLSKVLFRLICTTYLMPNICSGSDTINLITSRCIGGHSIRAGRGSVEEVTCQRVDSKYHVKVCPLE